MGPKANDECKIVYTLKEKNYSNFIGLITTNDSSLSYLFYNYKMILPQETYNQYYISDSYTQLDHLSYECVDLENITFYTTSISIKEWINAKKESDSCFNNLSISFRECAKNRPDYLNPEKQKEYILESDVSNKAYLCNLSDFEINLAILSNNLDKKCKKIL